MNAILPIMPTQNVNLSEQQVAFIHAAIEHGHYCNASEVVRAGLRALELQIMADKAKLERLKQLAGQGFAEISGGEYKTLTPHTLDDFLDSLA